ncbi:oligomeric, coiled-coil, peripheral membrane protein [Saxophila tyrrhenica]|uniref:Autophagy-related protein 11 n=1 Tax=Saxophila tyrrhenica TaxID=1690608 RepID=A0AAV9P9F3_9PEZI|nr:oligomeric, coiled-coil, peripheral membrane protein [Saxophila tyrrhenica]
MGQAPSKESQAVDWAPPPLSTSSASLLPTTDSDHLSSSSRSRRAVARMSITVYLAYTGQRLDFDPSRVDSIDAFKSWLQTQTGIAPRNVVLLTSQGKQVRAQTLLTENELFVFDASRVTSKGSASAGSDGPDEDFDPGHPPDTISNQNDLQAWQGLFKARKSWADGLLRGCETKAKLAQRYQDEQAVIERGLGAVVSSLHAHIKTCEQRSGAIEARSEEVLQDQEYAVGNWEANLESLRDIPAKPEFARFLGSSSSTSRRLSQAGNAVTLQSFVDLSSVRKAAGSVKSSMGGFADKVQKLREDLAAATKGTDELSQAVEQISANSSASSSSEPAQLLEEIELVVKKMSSDLEHVQALPRTQSSISQASKMALLHTRNYLPNLSELCAEMNELAQRAYEQRRGAADDNLEHMRTVSRMEGIMRSVYNDAKELEQPQDNEEVSATLNVISRLPSVYGALLVESVRRREWVAKMRRDAATLQEEVATYQDEEDKRRKKWVRSVEDVVRTDALRSNVLGIELSLINEGNSWPMVTRDDLQSYHDVLFNVYGECAVVEEIQHAIVDLDKPTRKQIKHAKAFKNGSMHEAAFGDTSLLLRGDDQYKSLKDANTRLEDELKGQKSRVRKLEDLLHRSSHIGRASTGDMFTPQSASNLDRNMTLPISMPSQQSEDSARGDSFRHQRKVSVQGAEEKKLARRVVDLENELQAAREEATTRNNSDAEAQKQVEEAMSTKKDLMENMEAQQREFATERRNLEKDLAEVKERAEELENEIERLVGSRDDERTGTDARAATYEAEIARLKEDASGHAARAATAQDARASMERKLDVAERARAEAETQLQEMRSEQEQRREAENEQMQSLATAHAQLSSNADAPSGLVALSSALEELSRKSAAHAKDLEEAIAFAKSENESLWASNERQKTELSAATQKQSEAEDEARQITERLATEEAKAQSLEEQLGEEQEQLRMLRNKFADGETGSEVLRQRVAEEEARAGKLSAELAESKSHINSLDVELMRLQKKHKTYHTTAETSTARLEKRAEHAKEVSQRLFAQNSRLTRLLERLGFAITYQDDTMVLERASKLAASTVMDPSNLSRTGTLTSPPPTRKSSTTDEPSDLSSLRWPDSQTLEDETTQFSAFLAQITRFNTDTFSEAVVKRVRDFEYTARKYNKEAKESSKRADAYKERSLKLKTEAQGKIAVKDFKEGDLALFLPTRGQAKGAWAAFNVGCPHYFLAEREGMGLGTRDFIVARISKVEERVVNLGRSSVDTVPSSSAGGVGEGEAEDENPFDLSDGLKWFLVHATEERGAGGAPTTPGLGKSTVAAANVDAKGSIRIKRGSKGEDATKHLNKSLDSRRSSSTSKKGVAGAVVPSLAQSGQSAAGSPTVSSFPDPSAASGGGIGGGGARVRSESQTSLRPPPAPAIGGGSGGGAGLGIIQDAHTNTGDSGEAARPPPADQIRYPSASRHETRSASPSKAQARQRSKSPSKSIRSLQRHLNPASQSQSQKQGGGQGGNGQSAAKGQTQTQTPVKGKQQKERWESLWSAEFRVESPSPSKGGGK